MYGGKNPPIRLITGEKLARLWGNDRLMNVYRFKKALSGIAKAKLNSFKGDMQCIVFLEVIFLFFKNAVYRAIRLKAALGNDAVLSRSGYRALVSALAYVSAIGISALANVGNKLGKCRNYLLKREEIKSGKIYQREAGGVGKEACILTALNLKYLNVACGVPAALNLT